MPLCRTGGGNSKTTVQEFYALEFNGPFLDDFTGRRRPEGVAQTSSLPYRGFPIRRCDQAGTACRLEVGDTAGWKPALRGVGSPIRAQAGRGASMVLGLHGDGAQIDFLGGLTLGRLGHGHILLKRSDSMAKKPSR